MVNENKISKKKVFSKLNYILDNLENDSSFIEGDIECEYTPFEESLKDFCDVNINELIRNNDCELAWECLSKIFEELVQIDDYIDVNEDLFRACELLTYYMGKILYNSVGALKNSIYNWIFMYIQEHEYTQFVEYYLKPFMEGDNIRCSDNYYTDYSDFEEMISINK